MSGLLRHNYTSYQRGTLFLHGQSPGASTGCCCCFFSLFFLFVKSFTKITRKCHILFLFFPTKAGVLATELKN